MNQATQRKLICLDIESTGTDVAIDRIISLALNHKEYLVNPGIPIPPDATKVHGIRDEDVKGCPPLAEYAAEIIATLQDSDLLGYNLINFDVPLLWEELYRCGHSWDLSTNHIIDAGNIFKKMEGRTLSDAVKFYLGRDHEDAHGALADVAAVSEVFAAQIERYGLDKDRAKLAEFSAFDNRVDLAGKIVLNDDAVPVYAIGKAKGVQVTQERGFGLWMLGKDFPQNTKHVLRKLLNISG